MKLVRLLAVSAWAVLLSATPPARAGLGADAQFLAAREAFRNGNATRVATALTALEGNDLQPWVAYYSIRMRLEDPGGEAAVADFLQRNGGSYPAEKLRADWLRLLGKRGQWADFRREWPLLAQPDQELTCYAWQERLIRDDPFVMDEARRAWLAGVELAAACDPVTDLLVTEKRIKLDDVWERIRRLLENNRPRDAREAARYLPENQVPDARALDSAAANPARYLDKLPAGFEQSRRNQEVALYALARLARNDPSEAATRWVRLAHRFSDPAQAYLWGQLAWQAAKRHMPEAVAWYDQAQGTQMSDDQAAWRVRIALRAQDWGAVRRAIEAMPADLAAQPEWLYWLGRARAAQGRKEDAQALYRRIAGQHHFYGNLADEELGRSLAIPPRTQPVSAEELNEAAANPGLRRALALLRLELRVEGVKEWNFTLRGMNDRQLLAAAEYARRNDVLDRAISAADKTRSEHDFTLRFPSPFRDEVSARAQELALDDGWIYGLIRQESRFVMSARSGVGARGLMQVMPATASWVAKKIGLSYHPGQAYDTATNVTLGTNYLKMVLTRLDNHPVLACAAYNAGPGRAQKWRGERPMEGAIYAESIPFNETRDYVKKVMSNSVYYAALFQDKPQSLKARLGIVPPRGAGDTVVTDLP